MSRFGNLAFAFFSKLYILPNRGNPMVSKFLPIVTNASYSAIARDLSLEKTVIGSLTEGSEVRKKITVSRGSKDALTGRMCMSSVATQHLDIGDGRQIAYKLTTGDSEKPTVVYVPGLLNTMEETKAVTLNAFCESSEVTLIRFDFEGIGESPGSIEKVHFGHWIDDLRHVVNKLCKTPVIYVAFSMGGWISTKVAVEMPEKLHSILYVAPGFNFLQYYYGVFYEKLSPEQKKALDDGECVYFNDLFMRKDFAAESVKHHINLKEKIPITAPIRILHGMLDRDAPYKVSLDLLQKFESSDVDLYLRKSGKHYMMEPSDLALMTSLLGELVKNYPMNK